MKHPVRAFLAGVAIIAVVGVAAVPAPILHVEEDVYDFGITTEGQRISFTFLLENQGDEVLVIERISASCGCTTTDIADPEIEPGEVVRLSGEVNTSGFGGLHISKRVYVFSNDPDEPEAVLLVTGLVVEESAHFLTVQELTPSLMLVLDVRSYDDYLAGHLAGAISTYGVDWDILVELLPKEMPILLYDQAGESAVALADGMLPLGFTDVNVLLGGLDEWIRLNGQRGLIDLPLTIGLVPETTPSD